MLRTTKNSNLIINNALEFGEELTTEANGKGRKFVSRFIEAGLAHYEQFGDVLITKETLDKFIQTMVGCPVIIKHKDITDDNADKERVGVVSKVWFDETDGWFCCEGIIWNKQAIDLVKNQGWNVSCTYDFESDFQKGTYHGKDYDMEFTNGQFLHLALVPNPRYERATIVMNAIDNEKGRWVTIKGTHVFIPDGKQIEDVMREKGWIEDGKSEKKEDKKGETIIVKGKRLFVPTGVKAQDIIRKEFGHGTEGDAAIEDYELLEEIHRNQEDMAEYQKRQKAKPEKKDDDLKGKYSKEDADFDEEQVKKDIKEAKKRGYDTVEKIAEYLGLDEDEVRGFEDDEKWDPKKSTFDWDDFKKWSEMKKKAKNSLVDEIVNAIVEEVCNSADFFEKGSGEQ